MADVRKDRTIMWILTAAAIINVLIVSLLLTHSADVHQPQGREVQHKLIVYLNETDQKLLKLADMSKKEPISLLKKNRIEGLPSGCPDDIFIITLVISTPDDSTRRHAIRSSWATTGNDHVLTVFLMGEHPDSRDRDGILRLNNEFVKYKDILNNYKHESRKAGSSLMVLLGIQWILEHCQQVRYVLIVHDTMFVNYRRLMKVLEHRDIQDNDGKLLIDICFTQGRKKRDIFMIAFINSHPKNWGIRNAIRRTWGSDLSIGGELIRVFFILGKQTHSANRSYIMTEDAQHQDILQGNFIDSFANRTLKVIAGLKWILKNCDHAHYLYAGAEDTFVNFKSIVRYLIELRNKGDARERFYLGSRIYGNERLSVKREKRANTKKLLKVSSKQYSGRYYPTYCSGSGYILSSDMVPSMYRTALRTPLIGVADVFQGILAKRLDVEPVGHPGFKTWAGRVDACSLRSYDTLTVRGITKTPEQLFHVWETYTNKFVNCSNV
ncbi:beta-1,3-galactosyltransferase 1-like [Strongylocentrotus purpuratus]|uniref:Hexosyltransferase n=1 Tax=Strongylocentrotus purpuratus TaxID=7668 RepID=A0A7M7PGS6_STRPU|nr:beta-1,3-galactosyltransferase 1-like [Strongylocentrotus purpuratus]